MAKNAIARRSSGGKWKAIATKARGRASSVARRYKQAEMPRAFMATGTVVAGSAACGALRAVTGGELLGMPVEPVAGVVAMVSAYFTKSPSLVYLGAGFLAPYVSDQVEDILLASF